MFFLKSPDNVLVSILIADLREVAIQELHLLLDCVV